MIENNNTEFKREFNEKLELEKTVISFLNSRTGGDIFIGIDNDGFIIGVNNNDIDKIQLAITDYLQQLKENTDHVDQVTDQATVQVTPQVKKLLKNLKDEMTRAEIQYALQLKDKKNFQEKYLNPCLEDGLVEMTQPDKPNSPTQKYRLTGKGLQVKIAIGGFEV